MRVYTIKKKTNIYNTYEYIAGTSNMSKSTVVPTQQLIIRTYKRKIN
jgi:hypothetical protein